MATVDSRSLTHTAAVVGEERAGNPKDAPHSLGMPHTRVEVTELSTNKTTHS
jgi:hypothetical protein